MSEKIINNQNEQEAIWESLSYFDDLETEEISLTDELIFLETSRITDALVKAKNNKSHAAKQLGIGRTLLIHKIKKYDLDKKELPIPY
jgi:transcriptional regulator with PAS, ATPase and Fis domain